MVVFMRCGCPECGSYMVQDERGLESGCICPNCGFICTACMGNRDEPKTLDEIILEAQIRKTEE